jgi:hypothetical protein
MLENDFVYDFKIGYLRNLLDNKEPIAGTFRSGGYDIIWGAVAVYNEPPPGALLIEIWGETNEDRGETATFRFWYAKETRQGRQIKGDPVLRNHLHSHPNGRDTKKVWATIN